jgi:hypothetical protein
VLEALQAADVEVLGDGLGAPGLTSRDDCSADSAAGYKENRAMKVMFQGRPDAYFVPRRIDAGPNQNFVTTPKVWLASTVAFSLQTRFRNDPQG